MGSDPIGYSRLWLKVERDSDVGGVWRYGEAMADKQLSLLGKNVLKCVFQLTSADSHRLQRQHRLRHLWSYCKCLYDTHHQPDGKRDEVCVDKKKERQKGVREWRAWRDVKTKRGHKKVEGLKWMGDGWYGLRQRLKGITPKENTIKLFDNHIMIWSP